MSTCRNVALAIAAIVTLVASPAIAQTGIAPHLLPGDPYGNGYTPPGGSNGSGVQGPAGQGFNFRGAWTANTAYAAYDVVTYGGQTYEAGAAFTSGSTFSPSNWNLWAAQGAQGPQGPQGPSGSGNGSGQGFNFRGAWAANTAYAAYDVVTYGGQTYEAGTAFTSGSTFNASQWNLWAAQGSTGPTGPTGATGSTGPAGPTGPAGQAATITARTVTGTTDALSFSTDNHNSVYYTSASATAVSVPAPGVGNATDTVQDGAGTETYTPASGVTMYLNGAVVTSIKSAYRGAIISFVGGTGNVVYASGQTQ